MTGLHLKGIATHLCHRTDAGEAEDLREISHPPTAHRPLSDLTGRTC